MRRSPQFGLVGCCGCLGLIACSEGRAAVDGPPAAAAEACANRSDDDGEYYCITGCCVEVPV